MTITLAYLPHRPPYLKRMTSIWRRIGLPSFPQPPGPVSTPTLQGLCTSAVASTAIFRVAAPPPPPVPHPQVLSELTNEGRLSTEWIYFLPSRGTSRMGQNNLLHTTEEKSRLDGSPKDNRCPSPYVKQSLKRHSAAAPYYHNSGRPPSSLTVNAPDSSSGDNYDA